MTLPLPRTSGTIPLAPAATDTPNREVPFAKGIDQGELSPRHTHHVSDFIADKLQRDGKFNADAARTFAKQIRDTRHLVQQQAYDTRFDERILRDVFTDRAARKNAHKQATFGVNNLLRTMDAVVIPQADVLVEKIEKGEPESEIRAAAEDFVRCYRPFYAPNTLVTGWNENNQNLAIPRYTVTAQQRKKDDPKALEASNLLVEAPEHAATVSSVLGRSIEPGYYLSEQDTRALREEGFDLSCLNPGVSAYWRRTSERDLAQRDARMAGEYPREDERIIYHGPRYRSGYSAKMTAYVMRDGKKHRFKIKLGPELHAELITCRLRSHMGFAQDHMQHRDELPLWLGERSYSQWERDLQVKYGTAQIRRHVLRRGKDNETGEDWVVLRDVALEARPESEIRVSPIDLGTYDGQNRREIRCMHVINAFLGLGDGRPSNFREVLVKQQDGTWLPEYRMHDVGRSLGRTTVLRRPRDLLNLPYTRNKPEEYDRNYIWANAKGDVKLCYNDNWRHVRDTRHATYADWKWAARLLASLTNDQIVDAVTAGAMPEALTEAYVYHIKNMRNRAAKAFGIEPNAPTIPGRAQAQLDIPQEPSDAQDNDGREIIRDGRIVATYLPGTTAYPKLQETWFTMINKGLSFASKAAISKDIESSLRARNTTALGPIARVENNFGSDLLADSVPASLSTLSLGPGINVTVARVVEPNRLYCGAEGKSRPYVVRDVVSFSLGVSTRMLSRALRRLGPDASVDLQMCRQTFEHVHFAETVADGYRSRPLLHRVLKDGPERLAVTSLSPGEVIGDRWAVGLSTAGKAGFSFATPFVNQPSVGSSTGVDLEWVRGSDRFYTKDQLGAMHLLLEKDTQRVAAGHLELASVAANPIVQSALLAAGGRTERLRQDYWNIEIAPPRYDLESAEGALPHDGEEADKLIESLRKLRMAPELARPERRAAEDLPEGTRLRFHMDAQKDEVRSRGALLYLLNRDRTKERTRFAVQTEDHDYDFFRLTKAKRGYCGIEDTLIAMDTVTFCMREGASKKAIVELDRDNPRSFVVMLDVIDYHRTLNRAGLEAFIGDLNDRFSHSGNEPFFASPPPSEQEPYEKVFANTRIYVNGNKLLTLLENLEHGELEAKMRQAFNKARGTTKRWSDPWRDKVRIVRKSLRAARALTQAAERLTEAMQIVDQEGAAAPKTPAVRRAQEDLAKAGFDLTYALYKNKLGVHVLHDLLGDHGMMVIGEIFGVHDRTNMLHEMQWVSRLRYAGKSWGKLTNVPPVSHYVRNEQPTPANEHVQPNIPTERFLGTIVTGLPSSIMGFGNR